MGVGGLFLYPHEWGYDTVDACEIPHHQKDGWNMLKPYKWWDKPPINWCRISSIHSIILIHGIQCGWHSGVALEVDYILYQYRGRNWIPGATGGQPILIQFCARWDYSISSCLMNFMKYSYIHNKPSSTQVKFEIKSTIFGLTDHFAWHFWIKSPPALSLTGAQNIHGWRFFLCQRPFAGLGLFCGTGLYNQDP